jgi:hypothetical protein
MRPRRSHRPGSDHVPGTGSNQRPGSKGSGSALTRRRSRSTTVHKNTPVAVLTVFVSRAELHRSAPLLSEKL